MEETVRCWVVQTTKILSQATRISAVLLFSSWILSSSCGNNLSIGQSSTAPCQSLVHQPSPTTDPPPSARRSLVLRDSVVKNWIRFDIESSRPTDRSTGNSPENRSRRIHWRPTLSPWHMHQKPINRLQKSGSDFWYVCISVPVSSDTRFLRWLEHCFLLLM